MAKRRTDSNRHRPGRRDLAAWLMMLLPGFMFVGLLAPAAVHVKPMAKADDYGPVSFRNFSPRRAFQFPGALANPFASETAGSASGSVTEPMFSGARYVADQARRVFEPAAKAETGEQIVLNDDNAETYVAETLFEADIDEQQQLVVDMNPLWDPALFDVMPFIFDRTGRTQWEDFHGTGLVFPGATTGTVVPEPTTGALLALGLAVLAVRRRRA